MRAQYERFRKWVDSHPRTGWYNTLVLTALLLTQLLDIHF